MMKKLLILPLLFIALLSCNQKSEIEISTFIYNEPECEACAKIQLAYPVTSGKNRAGRKINAALDRWVTRVIDLSPDQESETVEQAVTAFKEAYEKIKSDFPEDYTSNWETNISGELCYEDKQLLAVCMNTYSYTGGAHGYGSSHYLLFDKKKGEMIETDGLVKDRSGFMSLAEDKFRKQFLLDEHLPLNEQGYMFEGDQFHLPENIGYTSTGLRLIFNPYEIAPYSEGQIIIEIPYEEVNPFLRYHGKAHL